MNRSRYMTVNEKSPYPVKRRVRGHRKDVGYESAITLLPLESHAVGVEIPWASSPAFYRAVAPKSAKNREASSFVILGDTPRSPVVSRPGTPSGRISPFRGHGFKTSATTRPNSRATSPLHATPKKTAKNTEGPGRVGLENREKFNLYVGLPPKSPIGRSKSNLSQSQICQQQNREGNDESPGKLVCSVGAENAEGIAENCKSECEKTGEVQVPSQPEVNLEKNKLCEADTSTYMPEEQLPDQQEEQIQQQEQWTEDKPEQEELEGEEEESCPKSTRLRRKSIHKSFETLGPDWELSKSVDKLRPVDFYKTDRQESLKKNSPSPRNKSKTEKEESNVQHKDRMTRTTGKPPIPPKKIGMKTTLKSHDASEGKGKRPILKSSLGGTASHKTEKHLGTSRQNEKNSSNKTVNGAKKSTEAKRNGETSTKTDVAADDADCGPGRKDEGAAKLVPCYQPDKCNLAPPTMASPSPIITPSFSTPSTSADLAFNHTKSLQSISAAPTSVTTCSLSSVSSTVVLTGNLTRKETPKEPQLVAEAKDADKKPETLTGTEANGNIVGAGGKATLEMVKAGNKNPDKEKSSGEMASPTDVIKGQPEMEVLSPNNLRNSPPRMPPANVAWDENRMPNGDVPARAPQPGKFRRFMAALCRFFACLFCCRCCCKSCRGGAGAASDSSNCCSNPFKCLTCKCKKPKCCEGSRCCRRKPKPGRDDRSKLRRGTCCAKPMCSCCTVLRQKINSLCRCLFCLNLTCCQNFLKKCKCCHKLKCCQSNGCCSCCNPFAGSDPKKLIKKGSRASSNSKGNNQLDVVLVEHTSKMKAAIPVLPSCLAIFCLICNILIPGFGTIISGLLCLCFGKPRFSTNDNPMNRFKSFVINTIIGIAQAFTVVFCLVGWGWSVWWGVIMYKLSRRQKRLKLAEKNQKEAGSSNVNQNHGDVEQG